jgi:aminopeptidase N
MATDAPVAIGPYREHTDTGPHGLPISYWVRPQDDAVLPTLRVAPAAIRWLEARLGPLPSDRAGFVVVPQASGMETQDMITLGIRNMRHDDGQTVVHELAHQWYGDAVTPSDWSDVWMNEGMATYLQQEWAADERGHTWQEWESQVRTFDPVLRRQYGPPGAFERTQFARGNVYYCVALMWRTLRTRIGDATFNRLRRDWIQDHLFQGADRTELADWWSKASGQDLHAFFTTWLTSTTTPPTT